jgi:hypothetical protein
VGQAHPPLCCRNAARVAHARGGANPGQASGSPEQRRPATAQWSCLGLEELLPEPQCVAERLTRTQRALSVTQRALSATQRALSVTQRALSVTQRALTNGRAWWTADGGGGAADAVAAGRPTRGAVGARRDGGRAHRVRRVARAHGCAAGVRPVQPAAQAHCAHTQAAATRRQRAASSVVGTRLAPGG